MVYEHELRLFGKALEPRDEAALVGVAAHPGQGGDLGSDLYLLVKELYLLRAVVQRTSERSGRLIADKQHKALRPPQIVLEVVAYASGVAHAGGGNDDLGLLVLIYCSGFLLTDRRMQSGEKQRIFARAYDGAHLIIDIARVALQEYARRLDSKGAVNINGEIIVPLYKTAVFDLADEVQHFLRSADCKGGDNDIAAAVERALDAAGQRGDIVGALV